MGAQREELLRLVETLPEDEIPAVLDDLRRRAVRSRPWPPACSAPGRAVPLTWRRDLRSCSETRAAAFAMHDPWEDARSVRGYAAFARTYPTYRQTSRDLVRLAQLAPDAKVMDLACGTGVTTEAVLAALGAGGSVIAVDASQAMLTAAKSLVTDRRVRWLRSPAERLSEHALPGLDAVVCNSAIWQTDVQATTAAVRRVLRPGGRLVFNLARAMLADHAEAIQSPDPLLDLMKAIASREYGWVAPPAGVGTSRQELSERWLREELDLSGFRVEQAQALCYQRSLEEQRAWLSIPIFTRRRFSGLSYDQRIAVLGQAYERLADSRPEPATTEWMAFASVASQSPHDNGAREHK